jgi:hypothetical protein
MLGFLMFWLKRLYLRIRHGKPKVVEPSDWQTIDYLMQTGWRADYRYLDPRPRDEFGKWIPDAYVENIK